jgi:predicted aspartyl protease
MLQGTFTENTPWIQITLGWKYFVKKYWFILDTGFTGDLQVPTSFANELGLTPTSVVPVMIADGTKIQVPHALAIAAAENAANYVQVGISNGSPLLGINFLTKFGYRAVIDCKNRSIVLDKS